MLGKDASIYLTEMKSVNLQRTEFKDILKIKLSSIALICFFTCLSLGHASNKMMECILWNLYPDLHQSIIEHLDSLRCNLAMLDGPKHNVPEVFCWV